tara:strand:+ start:566 stop:766 length:201 start_codon:yes stop_codon:yes gene_type:complete
MVGGYRGNVDIPPVLGKAPRKGVNSYGERTRTCYAVATQGKWASQLTGLLSDLFYDADDYCWISPL